MAIKAEISILSHWNVLLISCDRSDRKHLIISRKLHFTMIGIRQNVGKYIYLLPSCENDKKSRVHDIKQLLDEVFVISKTIKVGACVITLFTLGQEIHKTKKLWQNPTFLC